MSDRSRPIAYDLGVNACADVGEHLARSTSGRSGADNKEKPC
jgi:hypothetical protein